MKIVYRILWDKLMKCTTLKQRLTKIQSWQLNFFFKIKKTRNTQDTHIPHMSLLQLWTIAREPYTFMSLLSALPTTTEYSFRTTQALKYLLPVGWGDRVWKMGIAVACCLCAEHSQTCGHCVSMQSREAEEAAGSGREIFVTVIEFGRNLPFEMRFLVDSKTYIYRNTVHSEPCLIIDHGSGFW